MGLSQETQPPQDCIRARAVAVSAIAQEIEGSNVGICAGSSSLKPLSSDLYGAGDSSIRHRGGVGDLGEWALNMGFYDHDVDVSPCAGLDQKASWGSGQSPDTSPRCGAGIVAAGGAGSTSLDSVQINRDRPKGWKRNCGSFTVQGASQTHAGKSRFCKVGCKCWDCSGCGPRKAARYTIRIRQIAERHKMKTLLTLTLDPSKLDGEESTKYIKEVFVDFRVYLRRWLGFAPAYVRVLEYQKNGNAHLHLLLNCNLPQNWVSETWSKLGGGRIVDIRRVDMHRISHYLSKYLTKQMLMCAPKRARRVTTSKGIKLLEKQPSDYEWRMLRIPILRLLDVYKPIVTGISQDSDGCVVAFETFESPTNGHSFGPPG